MQERDNQTETVKKKRDYDCGGEKDLIKMADTWNGKQSHKLIKINLEQQANRE